jgi:hypothetical protein
MWSIPLAHGTLGSWDEIVPVIIVGLFTVIMIVAGLISRRNDESVNEQPPATDSSEETDNHYRLD